MYIKRDEREKNAHLEYGKYDLKRLIITEEIYLEYLDEVINKGSLIYDKNEIYKNLQELRSLTIVLKYKLEKLKYI